MKRVSCCEMWQRSHEQVYGILRQFAEMQAGPNPLTPEEIDRLVEHRPELWSRFAGYGAKAIAARYSPPER